MVGIPNGAHPNSAFIIVLAAILSLSVTPTVRAQATEPGRDDAASSVRALVHTLDYVAQDYPGAVAGGAIVSQAEFAEMEQFGRAIAGMVTELRPALTAAAADSLAARASQLGETIARKAPSQRVAALSRSIRDDVIRMTGLAVAPLRWPDRVHGAKLYQRACAACHGESGDGHGPKAAPLDPPPADLVHSDGIASRSPFQVYNTVRLGVEGTSMPGYPTLTDEEAWDVAFFVKSLQSAEDFPEAGGDSSVVARVLSGDVSLQQVAALGDGALSAALRAQGVPDARKAVAALRLAAPQDDAAGALALAGRLLEQARSSYGSGRRAEARRHAIGAYLDGVEPVESALRAADAGLTTLLETQMMDVRTAIEGNRAPDDVATAIDRASGTIGQAAEVLRRNEPSSWFAFLMAASIMLREGLEAFLIILAILGVIRAVGERKAAFWVHGGWVLALLAGAAGWFYSDLLIRFGASRRELLEGGISLLAVGVLLYVGFWLHNKTEIEKWREFIDVRVKNMLNGGNLFGLAAIAFFAVFREAFESVLFLSALTLEEGTRSKLAIAGGAVMAIALVLVVAIVLLHYSARLPIKSLFKYSSFVMGVLSVVLVGKGIHAVQETGLVSMTMAPLSPRMSLLGIYPTVETLLAQAAILAVVAALWTMPRWKPRRA